MSSRINHKKFFVLALRNHLMSKYSTSQHYTPGSGDYESKISDGSYSLTRRDPSTPQDVTGFYFRKDLCYRAPSTSKEVLKDVVSFSRQNKDLGSKVEGRGNSLVLRAGNKAYSIASYVDEGYAGEIMISIMELPVSVSRAA